MRCCWFLYDSLASFSAIIVHSDLKWWWWQTGRKLVENALIWKIVFFSCFFFEQKREYLNMVTFIICTEFANIIEHTECILCLIDCVCFLSVICNECILLIFEIIHHVNILLLHSLQKNMICSLLVACIHWKVYAPQNNQTTVLFIC